MTALRAARPYEPFLGAVVEQEEIVSEMSVTQANATTVVVEDDPDFAGSADVTAQSVEFMRESAEFIREELWGILKLLGGVAVTSGAAYLLWLVAEAL